VACSKGARLRGCGSGLFAGELAQRHHVRGIDLSDQQIELAPRNLPEATFISADIRELELAPSVVRAGVALYATSSRASPRARGSPHQDRRLVASARRTASSVATSPHSTHVTMARAYARSERLARRSSRRVRRVQSVFSNIRKGPGIRPRRVDLKAGIMPVVLGRSRSPGALQAGGRRFDPVTAH
jgi:hypothetical protein